MAIAPISLGAVYKWVDEKGRVHYSDKPTDTRKAEEVDIEPGPSPEETRKAREKAEELKQRSHKEYIADQSEKKKRLAEKENRLVQKQQCLEARKQLVVLQELHLPAYRDEQGELRAKWKYDTYQGKREYLDDGMRASAIERAREKVIANCENPDDTKEQEIARMNWIRSEHCAKHRVELEALERPSAKAVTQDLEKKRRLVKMYCED
jgi:hypothetical protein